MPELRTLKKGQIIPMKILLSGSGTAGHITPLLAVAKAIHSLDEDVELSYVGQRGDPNGKVASENQHIAHSYYIFSGKFRRFHSLSLWQNITNFKVNLLNLRDLFLIAAGCLQAFFYLLTHRPDAILFKGGSVVVPMGFAAYMLRIPYITHDSDPIPGLANKLIARHAQKNAVVNDGVRAYPVKKTVVTGIPLAAEYEARRAASQSTYKKALGLPASATLLFVYTGTQGARKIDEALESFLPHLLERYPDLHVNYVFGRLNEASMQTRYQSLETKLAKRLHKMTFITNAYDHIAAADIVICRAGATSLAEFATIGRACVVVPAEQLTGGHQLYNAQIFADRNACEIVRESDLPNGLEHTVMTLLDSPERRMRLEEAIRLLAPRDAAKLLAEETLRLVAKS